MFFWGGCFLDICPPHDSLMTHYVRVFFRFFCHMKENMNRMELLGRGERQLPWIRPMLPKCSRKCTASVVSDTFLFSLVCFAPDSIPQKGRTFYWKPPRSHLPLVVCPFQHLPLVLQTASTDKPSEAEAICHCEVPRYLPAEKHIAPIQRY